MYLKTTVNESIKPTQPAKNYIFLTNADSCYKVYFCQREKKE